MKPYAIAAIFGLFPFAVTSGSALGAVTGKVWVVPLAVASNVTFPVPSATPDATFTFNAFPDWTGSKIKGSKKKGCYTIGAFLSGCANPVSNLTFSGQPNPLLGTPATYDTPMSGRNYGVLVEISDMESVQTGQRFAAVHDDGAALQINGNTISGVYGGTTPPRLDVVTYSGAPGTYEVDYLFGNALTGGATFVRPNIGNLP